MMVDEKKRDSRVDSSHNGLTSASPTLPSSSASESPAEGLGELQSLSGKTGDGTSLAHFRLIQEVGRGGMGVVYRAQDTLLDREVAVKVLSDELIATPGFQERFIREAKIVARMADQNIPQIHFIGRAEGRLFFAMEWVEGRTLEQLIREQGPFPLEKALDIAAQAARALQVAHRAGITHRDIKPSNLMLTREYVVKVLDFGIARSLAVHGDATMTGGFVGTPHYASPEQARGVPADARSDIYSLGATLFELLSGRPPFAGDNTIAILTERLVKPAPDLPDAVVESADVRTLVARMLATRPEDRFQSAGELLDAIGAVYPAPPVPARLSRRAMAFLTDLLLMGAPLVAIFLGFWAVMGYYPTTPLYGSIGGRIFICLGLLAYLVGWHVLLLGRAGQSLGQRLQGIRVATHAGMKPGLRAVVAKTVLWWGPVCLLVAGQTDWPPVLVSQWGGSDPSRFTASDLPWILALVVPNLPWVLAQLWILLVGSSTLLNGRHRSIADSLSRTDVVEQPSLGPPLARRRRIPRLWSSWLRSPIRVLRPAVNAAVLLVWVAGLVYIGAEAWRTFEGNVYQDHHLFETIKTGQPGWDRLAKRYLHEALRRAESAKNPDVLIFERHPFLPLLFGEARNEDPWVVEDSADGTRSYISARGLVTLAGFHKAFHHVLWTSEELAPVDEDQARRWDEARRQVYRGSVRHFLRALMHQRLREEGFEVLNPKNFVGLFRTKETLSHSGGKGDVTGDDRWMFVLVAGPELRVRVPGDEEAKVLRLDRGWVDVTLTGSLGGSWGAWDLERYLLPGTILTSYAEEQDRKWGTSTENVERVVELK